MAFETVLIEQRGAVGLVTLNRPKQLNALNGQLIAELNAALDGFDADPSVGVMVITGSDKAFAAGADIKEMVEFDYAEAVGRDFIGAWSGIAGKRKPVLAAVAGFALGGGCELAMMCDIIIAADNARFGQPEITIGTLPGTGGTQRLTRAIGKSKAMEMVLTGRMMDAAEAERAGLVSRVVPLAELIPETMQLADAIAAKSQMATRAAKQAVNAAFETSLAAGLALERQMFYASFATHDRAEGMQAFIEKRPPVFRQR